MGTTTFEIPNIALIVFFIGFGLYSAFDIGRRYERKKIEKGW